MAVVVAAPLQSLGSLSGSHASVSVPTSPEETFVSQTYPLGFGVLFFLFNLCTASASIRLEALALVRTALPLHVPPALAFPVLLALCSVDKRSRRVSGHSDRIVV